MTCRAVIHVWHHIPDWFKTAERLMPALSSLGGTVVELSSAYSAARNAWQRRTWEEDQSDRLSVRLLNLALSAQALASDSLEHAPDSAILQTLVPTIREMQERLATFLDKRETLETASVRESIEALVGKAVQEANERFGEGLFSLIVREHMPVLYLRTQMIRRALDELLKNAKAHLPPDELVRVELMHDPDRGVVVLDGQNAGYGVPA